MVQFVDLLMILSFHYFILSSYYIVFILPIYFSLMLFLSQFDVTNDSFENALNAANFTMHRNKNKLGNVPDRTE